MTNRPPTDAIPILAELDLVIRTERLVLRPHRLDDVDALWPYVSDPALPVHMVWAAHADKEVTRVWVTSQVEAIGKGSGMNWIIEKDGEVIGSVGLGGISRFVAAIRVDRAELGYWLGAKARNQGLMTEAARAAVAFGFEQLALCKITVGAFVENPPSLRVIEKLGFRHIGRRVADVWRDGRWYDQERYELNAGEWASRPGPT